MSPTRESATNNGQTYFVTSNTSGRKPLFRHDRWAKLLIETLYAYRPEKYLLHGFTVMPEHFHCLLTPGGSLELAAQCIKGGFSYRAKRGFDWKADIWVAGFSDHRIRDVNDYDVHQRYISRNAVKAGIIEREGDYAYCSANGQFQVDACPQWLKPLFEGVASDGLKPRPFKTRRPLSRR